VGRLGTETTGEPTQDFSDELDDSWAEISATPRKGTAKVSRKHDRWICIYPEIGKKAVRD
jgi:hypothetical protein